MFYYVFWVQQLQNDLTTRLNKVTTYCYNSDVTCFLENATPTRRSRRSEISINANHIGEGKLTVYSIEFL